MVLKHRYHSIVVVVAVAVTSRLPFIVSRLCFLSSFLSFFLSFFSSEYSIGVFMIPIHLTLPSRFHLNTLNSFSKKKTKMMMIMIK